MKIYHSHKARNSNIYYFALAALFCFFIGILFHRQGIHRQVLNAGSYFLFKLKENLTFNDKSTFSDYNMEHIYIDISFENLQKKVSERDIFLEQGYIGNGLPNEYVPIKIRHSENSFNAKMRFKGMRLDHINHPSKWSYKIKLKDKNNIFGLTEFSIQRPGTKNGLGEWLFMKLMKEVNISSPFYEFVKITQNGTYLGVYAIEGRFNQDFRSKNKLRDGPFIKFDPTLFIQNKFHLGNVTRTLENYDWSTYTDPITAYEINQSIEDTSFKNKINRGVSLFESFRNQTQSIDKTHNIKKLAKYFALCDITGSVHANQHSSLKAYYNPDTDLLEPVAWDANAFMNIAKSGNGYTSFILAEEPSSNHSTTYRNRRYEHRMLYLLEDEEFYKEYIFQLDSLNKIKLVEKFLIKNKSLIQNLTSHLYFTGGLKSYKDAVKIIKNNHKYIKGTLNPIKGLHAFFHKKTKKDIQISLANLQYLPISVLSLKVSDKIFFPHNLAVLPRRGFDLPPKYQLISFKHSLRDALDSIDTKNIKINYRIVGKNNTVVSDVFPFSNIDENSGEYILKKIPNHNDFSFLITDEKEKIIRIKSGKWNIYNSIKFPKNYRVVCYDSTTLNLLNGSMIYSNSPFEFYGFENNPISIISSDKTGKGLYISETSNSTFENVIFDNLSYPVNGNWNLSGSINFYDAPVKFNKCIFTNNRSEDALNIINSKFELINCHFQNIHSDAFDADFSSGILTATTFKNIGNDAIDISGTFCSAENIKIENANDKAISVGEESELLLNDIQISNSEICLASKDLSTIKGDNILLSNSKIGISVFQKKEEYGPGSVYLSNYNSKNIYEEFLIENKSILKINESYINTDIANVKNLLYGNIHGKATEK